MWSFDRSNSIRAAIEVGKHLVFFIAVTNTATTPGRLRLALLLFAFAAVVPGLGTYIHYANGELLVEGFRGRWYGVLGDPNHDAMAMVGVRTAGPPEAVADEIASWEEASYVLVTAGQFDLLVELVCGDRRELLDLTNRMRDLEGVVSTETFLYLDMVKQLYDWGTK